MIVAFAGKAGVGKDTSGDYYVEKHGAVKIALADPLKRICKDIYQFTDQQLWGPSALRNVPDVRYPRKQHEWALVEGMLTCACCGHTDAHDPEDTYPGAACYLTPRYALQLLGTEWGRHCYPLTWVRIALQTARKVLGSTEHSYTAPQGIIYGPNSHPIHTVCVTDVRFKNEVRSMALEGAAVCRVDRGLSNKAFSLHESENALDEVPSEEFFATIDNNEDIPSLHRKLEELWPQISK